MSRYHPVQWNDEKIARLWGWYSENMSETYLAHHSGHLIIDHVLRSCELKGKRIVDFGCGAGYLFEHLVARLGPSQTRYVGVEFSEPSIETMRRRLGSQPGFTGAVLARAFPVDIPSGQADVVFCIEVVEHLDDKQLVGTLREVSRMLE